MLSIVIPTLNRYSYLKETLHALAEQSYQDFEILIIDQTDKELADTASFSAAPYRYFWVEIKSASLARNFGLSYSRGDVVLFLDDDVIIENENFLKNHMRHYESNETTGVAGAILGMGQTFRDTRHRLSYRNEGGWLFFPINYDKPARLQSGWSGNLSVRRQWALEVGGMDESYPKGAYREESDFCIRYTKKYGFLNFDPEAYLVHIGAPSGGLRTWQNQSILKAQHHFNGGIYFIMKNVSFKDYPVYIFATMFFFFYDKRFLYRPHLMFVGLYRVFLGIVNARKLLKRGPQYITFNTIQDN